MLEQLLGPTIRQVKSPLTTHMLSPLDPRCDRVQFDSLLTDPEFEQLSTFLADYPQVALRAYGGSSATTIRDLDFLRFFPQLRQFSVDVYHLQDASGLRYLPDDLSSFGFGWTVSRRRFSLAPLVRFTDLRSLFLEGHTKDIEAVSCLPRLEALSLRSITLPDLAIFMPLRQLRSLDIKLGGTSDLSMLPSLVDFV